MQENNLPLPAPYQAAISFTLRRRAMGVLQELPLDIRRFERIVADYRHWNHEWSPGTQAALEKAAEERVFRELQEGILEPNHLEKALQLLRLLKAINVSPELWQSQNIFISALRKQPETLLLGMEREDLMDLGKELNIAMVSPIV